MYPKEWVASMLWWPRCLQWKRVLTRKRQIAFCYQVNANWIRGWTKSKLRFAKKTSFFFYFFLFFFLIKLTNNLLDALKVQVNKVVCLSFFWIEIYSRRNLSSRILFQLIKIYDYRNVWIHKKFHLFSVF